MTLTVTGSASAHELFGRTRDLFDEHTFAVHAGVGVTDFLEGGTRTLTEPGGNWTVRASWGMAKVVGLEVAYLGAAFPVDTPTMTADASVIETGAEALARVGYPMLPSVNSFLTPYLTGGAGWSAFNLIGVDDNSADIANADGVFSLPLGFGVAAGYKRLSVDVRWIHRTTFGDQMFRSANLSSMAAGQNSVAFSGTVGYRF